MKELIQRLDDLYAKATPGEWRHSCYMSGTQNVEFPGSRGVTFVDRVIAEDTSDICTQDDIRNFIHVWHRPTDAGNDADPERTVNARLIAALHNAYPALRDALERMQKALTRLLSSDDYIAQASENDLCVAANDPNASALVREQAASILEARAALDHDQPIGSGDA